MAPAGTPRPIVDQLAAQIGKLMADPATREKLIDAFAGAAAAVDAGQLCRLHQEPRSTAGR